MSTTTETTPTPTPACSAPGRVRIGSRIAGPRPTAPVPFARLVMVEWRKQVDTRAGRWLMGSIGLIVLAALAVLFFVEGGDHAWVDYLGFTALPLGYLVPVVGILAVTSEWSQRTALVTFTHEPRRTRVVTAKVVAAAGTGVATTALALALSAAVHGLAVVARGATGDWSITTALAVGMLLFIVLGLLQGVGFGMLLLNTPGAIVSFFLLPIIIAIVFGTVPGLSGAMPWVDLGTAMGPLTEGQWLQGTEWAHLASTVGIWVIAPLALGTVRVLRSEIKTA